jgi:hypothetical protein
LRVQSLRRVIPNVDLEDQAAREADSVQS